LGFTEVNKSRKSVIKNLRFMVGKVGIKLVKVGTKNHIIFMSMKTIKVNKVGKHGKFLVNSEKFW
jgi:hypothetical protein